LGHGPSRGGGTAKKKNFGRGRVRPRLNLLDKKWVRGEAPLKQPSGKKRVTEIQKHNTHNTGEPSKDSPNPRQPIRAGKLKSHETARPSALKKNWLQKGRENFWRKGVVTPQNQKLAGAARGKMGGGVAQM